MARTPEAKRPSHKKNLKKYLSKAVMLSISLKHIWLGVCCIMWSEGVLDEAGLKQQLSIIMAVAAVTSLSWGYSWYGQQGDAKSYIQPITIAHTLRGGVSAVALLGSFFFYSYFNVPSLEQLKLSFWVLSASNAGLIPGYWLSSKRISKHLSTTANRSVLNSDQKTLDMNARKKQKALRMQQRAQYAFVAVAVACLSVTISQALNALLADTFEQYQDVPSMVSIVFNIILFFFVYERSSQMGKGVVRVDSGTDLARLEPGKRRFDTRKLQNMFVLVSVPAVHIWLASSMLVWRLKDMNAVVLENQLVSILSLMAAISLFWSIPRYQKIKRQDITTLWGATMGHFSRGVITVTALLAHFACKVFKYQPSAFFLIHFGCLAFSNLPMVLGYGRDAHQMWQQARRSARSSPTLERSAKYFGLVAIGSLLTVVSQGVHAENVLLDVGHLDVFSSLNLVANLVVIVWVAALMQCDCSARVTGAGVDAPLLGNKARATA